MSRRSNGLSTASRPHMGAAQLARVAQVARVARHRLRYCRHLHLHHHHLHHRLRRFRNSISPSLRQRRGRFFPETPIITRQIPPTRERTS